MQTGVTSATPKTPPGVGGGSGVAITFVQGGNGRVKHVAKQLSGNETTTTQPVPNAVVAVEDSADKAGDTVLGLRDHRSPPRSSSTGNTTAARRPALDGLTRYLEDYDAELMMWLERKMKAFDLKPKFRNVRLAKYGTRDAYETAMCSSVAVRLRQARADFIAGAVVGSPGSNIRN